MKILIFGGNSFTAQHFAWSSNHDCKFVSRSAMSTPMSSPDAIDDLSDLLLSFKPDVIINLISISTTTIKNSVRYVDANFETNKIILKSCSKSKIKLRKFINVSSAHVYGSVESSSIDENTPVNPTSLYAKSKLMSELLSDFYKDEFPIIIARPFNYTGVGQNERDFFIPKLVSAVSNKLDCIALGNLDVVRDFSDVRDISRYYEGLIHLEDFSGPINLCSGRGYHLAQLVELVQEISGHNLRVQQAKQSLNLPPTKVQVGCNKKLTDLTSLGPEYSMAETIEWMLNHFKKGH